MKRIVFRIREAMVLKGVTQQELIKRTGLRPNTIGDYLKTDSPRERIKLEHISAIAEALDISDLNELMYLEEVK